MATNSNLTFDYERQNNFDEPAEDPGIRSFEVFGELADIREDPEWMKTRLYGIYNDVEPLLNALQERSKGVTSLALDEYKPEVQEAKRIAHMPLTYFSAWGTGVQSRSLLISWIFRMSMLHKAAPT